jgi:hypothetical protein
MMERSRRFSPESSFGKSAQRRGAILEIILLDIGFARITIYRQGIDVPLSGKED